MADSTKDLAAELDQIQDDLSVASVPPMTGDHRRIAGDHARRLLAAVRELLKLADGWEKSSALVPLIDREAAALGVKGTIRAVLTGEQPAARQAPAAPRRVVWFDLMPDDPDYYFVLTEALGDFAARERDHASDGGNAESRIRWAETAEAALERIEAALSGREEAAGG
jgi:hypothetical protein